MNFLQTTSASNRPTTMSSKEIAELTGKEHFNVLQDIDRMLTQLSMDVAGYLENTRHPQNGQTYRQYRLPKDLTITLVSGYNVVMRHRIVTRWQELEAKPVVAIPQNFGEALRLAAQSWERAQVACRTAP